MEVLNRHKNLAKVLNILLEMTLIFVMYWLATLLRVVVPFGEYFEPWDSVHYVLVAITFTITMVVVTYMSGAYFTLHIKTLLNEIRNVAQSTFIGIAIDCVIIYAFELEQFSRLLLAYFAVLSFIAILIKRILVDKLVNKYDAKLDITNNVLLIGSGRNARTVYRTMLVNGYMNLSLYGYLSDEENPDIPNYMGKKDAIRDVLDNSDVTMIIIADPDIDRKGIKDIVVLATNYNIRVSIAPEFSDFMPSKDAVTSMAGNYLCELTAIDTCNIMGVNISVTNMEKTCDKIRENLKDWSGKYICVSNVHTTVTASEDEDYKAIQNKAVISLPDGGPLSRFSREHGHEGARRVTGPDLMKRILKSSHKYGWKHFFYGSTQETLDKLRDVIEERYPGAEICGMISPPFRPLTIQEDDEVIKAINEAAPDFVWVGLGAPKQEVWMAAHEDKVKGLMIGVGAAFDYECGTIKRAPRWMQDRSLEWLYRLIQDPKRLFTRYLRTNTKYLIWKSQNGGELDYFGNNKAKKKRVNKTRTVYICGAKGISQYGGFESFVQNLIEAHKDNKSIKYHIMCKANGQGSMDVSKLEGASEVVNGTFEYCNAMCHLVEVPDYLGSAQAVIYDIKSLKLICDHIKANKVENPAVYILACRIGPFVHKYVNMIHNCGGKVFLNPDGHEWMRRKWSKGVRMYWKLSEKLMVKHADRIICDSKHIEDYIKSDYCNYNPSTTYISYGAHMTPSEIADDDEKIVNWYEAHNAKPGKYYLVVGRFVNENNYDVIIREFMKSTSCKKLVIITTENKPLMDQIEQETGYKSDERIIFANPVYDLELLKKIRENAYAYIHGHEVGGTNPSLLEALASTKLNLVLGVGFNKEVVEDAAFCWEKDEDSLKEVINMSEKLLPEEAEEMGIKAKNRIKDHYSWKLIADEYEKEFCKA